MQMVCCCRNGWVRETCEISTPFQTQPRVALQNTYHVSPFSEQRSSSRDCTRDHHPLCSSMPVQQRLLCATNNGVESPPKYPIFVVITVASRCQVSPRPRPLHNIESTPGAMWLRTPAGRSLGCTWRRGVVRKTSRNMSVSGCVAGTRGEKWWVKCPRHFQATNKKHTQLATDVNALPFRDRWRPESFFFKKKQKSFLQVSLEYPGASSVSKEKVPGNTRVEHKHKQTLQNSQKIKKARSANTYLGREKSTKYTVHCKILKKDVRRDCGRNPRRDFWGESGRVMPRKSVESRGGHSESPSECWQTFGECCGLP